VRKDDVGEATFWYATSDRGRTPAVKGVHLLPVYDELLVGYGKTRHFGDKHAAAARAAWKDRSMPNGVVLQDGRILGHWRRRLEPKAVHVEVLTYKRLVKAGSEAVGRAAATLGEFVGKPVSLELGRVG
jgi:hypothetical protein